MAGLTTSPGERDPRRFADVQRQAMEGKSNATVTATLTPNATTTTVQAPTCSPSSAILPSALTSDAANDAATTWFTPQYGQFIVHHANNARVDRTFIFVVHG